MKTLTITIAALLITMSSIIASPKDKNNRPEKPTFPTIERQIEIIENKIDGRIERVKNLEIERETKAFNHKTAFSIESNIENSHKVINGLQIELNELKNK